MKMMMTPFEIFTAATVVGAFLIKVASGLIAFVRKVNKFEKSHKSVLRLHETVKDHETRIILLENRPNNL